MRAADRAWVGLAGYVLAYNLLAPDGEMLSEGADRYQERRPWLTRAAITLVAVHLSNGVPAAVDPVHWAFVAARGARRAVSRPSSAKKA